MPKLDAMTTPALGSNATTTSTFHYSAIRPERLNRRAYSLMTLAVDTSGSMAVCAKDLCHTLNHLVHTAQQQVISDNILMRTLGFEDERREWHGFQPLKSIQPYGAITTGGGTALYDATFDALNATVRYAKILADQGFRVNALFFVLTDGDDNGSQKFPQEIAKLMEETRQNEIPSRLYTALIGLNSRSGALKRRLQTFQRLAQLDDYVDIPKASPRHLAELEEVVGAPLRRFAQEIVQSV